MKVGELTSSKSTNTTYHVPHPSQLLNFCQCSPCPDYTPNVLCFVILNTVLFLPALHMFTYHFIIYKRGDILWVLATSISCNSQNHPGGGWSIMVQRVKDIYCLGRADDFGCLGWLSPGGACGLIQGSKPLYLFSVPLSPHW